MARLKRIIREIHRRSVWQEDGSPVVQPRVEAARRALERLAEEGA